MDYFLSLSQGLLSQNNNNRSRQTTADSSQQYGTQASTTNRTKSYKRNAKKKIADSDQQEDMTIVSDDVVTDKDVDNTNNNDADDGTEQSDDFSSRMKLPNEEQIKEAFSNLRDFSLASMLPKDIKLPLASLGEQLKKELDGVNIALETNVKKLFGNSEIESIQEALVALVSKNDRILVTEKAKKTKDKKIQEISKRNNINVQKFYPHLLELIQALLTYHVNFANKVSHAPNQPASIVFTTWMQVLGYLTSIQHVIVYGARNSFFKLDAYPIDIDNLSNITEKSKNTVQRAIEKQTDTISRIQAKLHDKQREKNAIDEKYQGYLQQLANHETILMNLQKNLDALTDPQKIAEKNVQQIANSDEN